MYQLKWLPAKVLSSLECHKDLLVPKMLHLLRENLFWMLNKVYSDRPMWLILTLLFLY